MADDNKLDFILNLDDAQFAKAIVSSIENIESLVGVMKTLGEASALIGAAFYAVKTAVDMSFEAESIRALNTQFETLAQQSGISAQALKASLASASDGLLSETEQLKLANKAMIDLGTSSSRIGELLEVAHSISQVTGRGIAEVFETISHAAATGQTRALKDFGLVIDSAKVFREYAASLGIAENALSEAGQRQAILNETIRQGRERYSQAATAVTQAADAWAQFKAAIKDVGEIVTLVGDKIWGNSVRSGMSFMRDWAQGAKTWFQANFGEGAEAAAAKTSLLESRIKDLKVTIIDLEQRQKSGLDFTPADTQSRLQAARTELEKYEAQLGSAVKKQEEFKQKAEAPAPSKTKPATVDPIDHKKEQENLAKFHADMVRLSEERLQSEQQLAERVDQVDAIHLQQRTALQQQYQARIDEIRQSTHLNQEQKAEEIARTQEVLNVKLLAMEDSLRQKRLAALDEYLRHSTSTADGIARAFESGSRRAEIQLRDFGATGARVYKSFENNATSALLAVGAGQKSASEAAKGFIFGMLADEAEARGKMMLLAAIWPPNPAAMAAGAGLIALSGFLRAQAGSAGASAAGDGGGQGGGGAGAANSSGTDSSAGASEKQIPKAVTIQIQGHYFETEQTKQRLVEMIRDSSDATDFTIRGGT